MSNIITMYGYDLIEITDDNMAVEYKHKVKHYFKPEMSWEKMFKRLF